MKVHLSLAGVLLLLLAVAGCTGQAAAAGPSSEAELFTFAECMRDNGYAWPDLVDRDGARDNRVDVEIDTESADYREAEAACQPEPGTGDEDAADFVDREFEAESDYAACMRGQGLEFPDPVREGNGFSGPAGPMDGDWESFVAASEVCDGP